MSTIKVAILGGSFNPPHLGHLSLADAVLQDLGLERVFFIPAGHSPHKTPFRDTSNKERLEMVCLAIEENPKFSVIDWELEQVGPSYTLKTVEKILVQKGLEPGEIGVVVGEDLLARLHEWHEFEYLCSLVTWILVRRSAGVRESNVERFFSGVNFQYVSVDNVFLPVSSSQVRSLAQEGRSFRYLIPQKVYAYIQYNSVYTTTTNPGKTEALREKSPKS